METFLKVLDPEDTSTGGGAASAIAGAMAAGLLAMVSKLSSPAFGSEEQAFFARIYKQAAEVSHQLQVGSQEDSLAFQAVRSAYRLPRQTEKMKIARQMAIQEAWRCATQTPLNNAEGCLRVCELGVEMVGRVNPKVLSDFNCSLLLARAGFLGCLENVAVNLPSLKDLALMNQLSAQADALRARFEHLSAA